MPTTNEHHCEVCQTAFDPGDHGTCYESVYLMLNICPACMADYVDRYGTACVNCRGHIVPHSQVAVYKGDRGQDLFGHTTVACNPAGNSFYGYWGKGKLNSAFRCIEQC